MFGFSQMDNKKIGFTTCICFIYLNQIKQYCLLSNLWSMLAATLFIKT